MKFVSVLIMLAFLSSCASGGYHRSYIISDTVEDVVSDEQSEKR